MMTIYQLIKQEQDKHPNKVIGDEIALQIISDGEEIYFCDCNQVEAEYDFEELLNVVIKSYEYEEDYGELEGKLKLIIEVL